MHFLVKEREVERTFLRRHPHIHVASELPGWAVIAKRTMDGDVDSCCLERAKDPLRTSEARDQADALSFEPARVDGRLHALHDIDVTLEP